MATWRCLRSPAPRRHLVEPVDAVGEFVCTPGSARALLDRIEGDVAVLDADVQRSADTDFKAQWTTWRTSWRAWQTEHRGTLELLADCGTVMSEAEKWETSLKGWREMFTKRGGQPASPAPVTPPPPARPLEQATNLVSTLTMAALVFGGLYLLLPSRR